MGDEQHRQPPFAAQGVEQGEDLRLHGDIERRSRFVADQQGRLRRQRPGDRDPLALPARELVRIAVRCAGIDSDLLEQHPDALLDRRACAGKPAEPDRLGEAAADRPARIEAGMRILEDHLWCASPAGGQGRELDRAGVRPVEPGHQARQRRLAAARFADEGKALALQDIEVDPGDRGHSGAPGCPSPDARPAGVR